MSKSETSSLLNFKSGLEVLRGLDPEITSQKILILVTLFERGPLQQRDLVPVLGMDQTACSRNVLSLTQTGVRGAKGLGLVETFDGPADRRQKMVTLTARGQAVRQEFLAAIS